jgi:tRNA A37 threonylcarbamoyladenosine synthetase subunit TsaC/SUA5/YrdC
MLAKVQKRKAWLAIKIPSNSISGALVGAANKAIAANHPLWSKINKG